MTSTTTTNTDNNKPLYDLILFGVTGFTGKLAAEYLLRQNYPNVKWAACARSEEKAKPILEGIVSEINAASSNDNSNDKTDIVPPTILVADLICSDDEASTNKLRDIVKSTRVVITTAGPFEKYGMTLHKLCAEEGVHYADITGETSFVRRVITEHDRIARQTGACLVSHCGNDCIPQDLTVFELHRYATSQKCTLKRVVTYDEFPNEASMSGGTLTTALYQLSKPKNKNKTNTNSTGNANANVDPLVQLEDGTKSKFSTQVTHKKSTFVSEFQRTAGPWLMAPVMANCVRRSNALLGYAPELAYGDALLEDPSWIQYLQRTAYKGVVGAALYLPPLRPYLLPQPGQGPSRETMEAGFLKLHGRAIMVKDNKEDDDGKHQLALHSLFHFQKDTGYLMTAEMLVESGVLLVEMDRNKQLPKPKGGVLTPAAAFGHYLTERITKHMNVTLDIQQVQEQQELKE